MYKLATLSALLSAIALVAAGGPEICTGSGGCTEYQNQSARFDELLKQCVPCLMANERYGVNSIDTGAMVSCCESRGAGSSAESFGADNPTC
ncbi:hypothetical protein E3P92_03561 [Wallemia ichthyophaga]|uniref:Uncharacterized protein n=1 Tax=Wallemia ichthyophaga TaxID=245174 RepID=A0A4T0G7A9_WALIC|nr:hypothetical protein E3P91_03611 [Wallemia ichthyophaga]TIA95912.1 hypothetical protein E3P95_03497 [Wallemia ichthyophaga]TIA96945.1 hypothetical protein E3P94_03504 [Wallemia ichthyophaga]TIB09178.1 hypothetical protein E3P92_03561 [Wallemia ichthyophaga]TIB09629.1 hypothetical protein E3P93_03135 [Wallemia ichthyophaga]